MSYTKTGNPVELLHVVKNCITSLILQGKTSPTGVGQLDKKIVFDGSADESWVDTIGAGTSLGIVIPDAAAGNVVFSVNGKTMPDADALSIANEYSVFLSSGTTKRLYVATKKTVSEFKAAISTHPLTVYYQSTSYPTATQVYIGFSVTDANGYRGYAAGPMARLMDGDTVDFITGKANRPLSVPTTETVPISEPITNAAGTVTLSAENTLQVTVGVMSEEVSPPTPLSEPMVNGKLFSEYGGAMLLDYTVGGTEITNDYFKGRNRSSWNQLSTVFGMRPVKLSIVFTGSDLNRVTLQKSQFDAACFGQIELFLPDGFFYTANTVSVGDSSIVGIGETQTAIKADYSFEGIRHSPMVTATLPAGGGTVYCQSTLPFTDCILSCTVTAPAASYVLGGATFKNVQAGETLVFDGINKRILRGGAPGANNVNWTVFPQLVPGANNLTCVDAATVQYYPVYM